MPESLLYLYHQEGVCVILGVGGWSSPLRLPVKFGQVTVTRSGPRPPQRTGNAKQEVAVNDVRRCKDRENAILCLRKSTCEGFLPLRIQF